MLSLSFYNDGDDDDAVILQFYNTLQNILICLTLFTLEFRKLSQRHLSVEWWRVCGREGLTGQFPAFCGCRQVPLVSWAGGTCHHRRRWPAR